MIGALQYLTITRPDIAYIVHMVSHFMHAPQTSHFDVAKRIYRVLAGDAGSWLLFQSNYSDWAGCPDSSRSTTGFAIFLGSNLISWRSKERLMVSRSSMEAKYHVAAYTVDEILWL